jgi:asparagine synthase (glutamine-hydrolysing)
MTIFAGILSRGEKHPLALATCESLANLISRDPRDKVTSFKDERCFFAKVDINAYRQPAFRVDDSGSVAMLAGEPLLSLGAGSGRRSRADDLALLHRQVDAGDWDLLKRARGTYCAAYYEPKAHCLTLVTDKLGVRSLYLVESEGYVYFATALRILYGLDVIPKRMDVRAVTEIVTLHAPLSTRTPYVDVSLMRAGEIVRVVGGETTRSQYWRWDDVRPANLSPLEVRAEAYARFRAAVDIRLQGDSRAFALLSGGLDSRCVVSALRAFDVVVHSLNFSPARTQDQFFASEYAHRAGTHHEEVPMDSRMIDSLGIYQTVATALRTTATGLAEPPDRPHVVWGGNGGSVGLGHVYLTPQLIDTVRAGKREGAIELFLRHAQLAKWIIRPGLYRSLSASVRRGIAEELEDLHSEDPGRAFHLYLMLNDQRRHMCEWLEHVDLHRLESQLPFYDGEFLELIVSTPVDMYLGHRFYTEWLNSFPPSVTAVPWQTYPGHVPCPVKFENDELGYQFGDTFSRDYHALHKRALLEQADEMLRAREFPSPIIDRLALRLATWAYRLGLGDYGYMIGASHAYYTYWAQCHGQYVTPRP